MNDLHSVGVSATNAGKIEAVGPQFIREGLLRAREKSWKVAKEILQNLKVGTTELEAQKMALATFEKHGVTKHWHKPYIRFGPGTALTFHDSLQPSYRLQPDDLVYFDLGPVWMDVETGLEYEGDIGDSFVFGKNPEAEKCIEALHTLFNEAFKKWKKDRVSGEWLYEFFTKRSAELGYELIEKVDGHRVSDYPHVKYSKERLSQVRFVPKDTLWILELQIKHPTLPMGAFYEDLLFDNNPGAPVRLE